MTHEQLAWIALGLVLVGVGFLTGYLRGQSDLLDRQFREQCEEKARKLTDMKLRQLAANKHLKLYDQEARPVTYQHASGCRCVRCRPFDTRSDGAA